MDLQKEIETLLNRHSRENDSDTPDFIPAEYLMACLDAFESSVNKREVWCGRGEEALEASREEPRS